MNKIVIATANPAKAREFRQMLDSAVGRPMQWSDLSCFSDAPVAEETGHTFRANACLKASYYAKSLNAWALADDSGLVVDALDGKPGVYSARWAKMHNAGAGDLHNNRLLLKQMERISDRRRAARFTCVLALSDPCGRITLTVQDSVEGMLLRSPRGDNGFGYDPLFFYPPLGKTTAELSPEEKHAISHRGKALRRLKELLARLPQPIA